MFLIIVNIFNANEEDFSNQDSNQLDLKNHMMKIEFLVNSLRS